MINRQLYIPFQFHYGDMYWVVGTIFLLVKSLIRLAYSPDSESGELSHLIWMLCSEVSACTCGHPKSCSVLMTPGTGSRLHQDILAVVRGGK